MKSEVHYIVLQSTPATTEKIVDAVKDYWTKQSHWKNPGYQYIVSAKGTIEKLLLEKSEKNPVKAHGRNSIHISFVCESNLDLNSLYNSFMIQLASVYDKLKELKAKHPNAVVVMQPSFQD